MSEAESKFRAVVWQAYFDAAAHGGLGVTVDDVVDAIVCSLKLDNWFINNGEIREIEEVDWLAYEDNSVQYAVWVTVEREDNE